MQAAAERLEFTPPPQRGVLRSLILALLAHLLLLAALTWGVHWKREAENLSVEAELWSAVPQQAAPKAVETPPPPPAPPVQKEEVQAPPPPPVVKDADIALEREKKRREAEKQRALEDKQEREKKLAAEKKKKEEQREREREKAEKAEKAEKEKAEKARQERLKAEAQAKREKEQKDAEAAKRQEALRQENIRRMQGLAGANGEPNASGTATRSSGPSAGYAGRIRARVKPNIVFTDDVAGNPTAEVEVRTSPDGTIVGRRLLKSSGIKTWDEAVLKAIDKTEVLPRDVDGRVPTAMVISFRPKD